VSARGEPRPPRPAFATTRWRLVDCLRGTDPASARAALDELCTLT
jgi:hypothetical protein